MTRLGARGVTAAEMDRVMAATAAQLRDLNGELKSRNGEFEEGRVVDLAAANRVFVQRDFELEQPFVAALKGEFDSTLGLVDYKTAAEPARREINRWVEDQTRDRIRELIPSGVIDDLTRLILVNAVYLKADWLVPFDKGATKPGPFKGPSGDQQVAFMHGSESRRFATGDGWKAVELPYAGNKLAMTVVVPDAGKFDDVAGSIDDALFADINASEFVEVDLALPKFNFEKSLKLKPQLSALGMPTAFTDSADFSGMTREEPLTIEEVVHQANISLDEKGTIAAAATAVIARAVSAPARIEPLVVDRPFLFFLRDLPTGAILFAGQVTNPTPA
jgi:serpin B